MTAQTAPTLDSLQDMFPALERSFLQDVLEQAGDKVLDVLLPATTKETFPKSPPGSDLGIEEGPPSPVHPQIRDHAEPCPFTPLKPIAQPADKAIMAMLFPKEQPDQAVPPKGQPDTIMAQNFHQLKVSTGPKQGSDMDLDQEHLDFGVRTPTLGTPHRMPSHANLSETFTGWQTTPHKDSTTANGLLGVSLAPLDSKYGQLNVRGWWPAYKCDSIVFETRHMDVDDIRSLDDLDATEGSFSGFAGDGASAFSFGSCSGSKRCKHEPANSVLMELIHSAQSLGLAQSSGPSKSLGSSESFPAVAKTPAKTFTPTPSPPISPFTTCANPPILSSNTTPSTPSSPLLQPTLTPTLSSKPTPSSPLLQPTLTDSIRAPPPVKKPPASTCSTASDQSSCSFLLDMLPQPAEAPPTGGQQRVGGAGGKLAQQQQPAAAAAAIGPFCSALQQLPTRTAAAAAEDPPTTMTSEQQIAHFRSMFPTLPTHTITSVTQLHGPEQILETLLRIQAAFDQPQAYDSEGGLREAITPPSPRSLQPSWEAYSESSDSPSDPLASLSMQEKVEHLRVSFPSIKPEEVMTALNDENGRTDRAAALLQLYVQDDAQEVDASAAADEEFCRQLMLEESQAKALEEADAKLAKQLLDEEYANRQAHPGTAAAVPFQTKPPPPPPPKRKQWKEVVSSRSKAKLQHLNRCYPDADQEVLASTLDASGNDIRSCKQLLSQAGHPERKVRASTKTEGFSADGTVHHIYAAKPTGPRDGQHQALYEEARRLANKYRNEAKDCFQKSTDAKNKRQFDVSQSYTRQGIACMAKAKRENDIAAQRIFKGVNRTVNVWECDVHGLHIPEALKKVTELITQMTSLGGRVHLKIITGQGHHSVDNTPKIWPAMRQFLEQRDLEYKTFPGYFVVPLNSSEDS